MLDWQLRDVPTDAPPVTDRAATTVDSIRRFAGQPGVYQVRWRDGRRKRAVLVEIDQWRAADQIVADAVSRACRTVERSNVVVPSRAWR